MTGGREGWSKPVALGPSGPAVRLIAHEVFEVVGLPEVSPTFKTRRAAERWLARKLEGAWARLAPRCRTCLCCGAAFRSTGPGNRLCDACRRRDPGPVAMAWARPARRGEGVRA